ncbi:transposase [Thermus altitudinis]
MWVREFTCPSCGALLHRDVAAAANILAKAWTGPSATGLYPEPRSPAL